MELEKIKEIRKDLECPECNHKLYDVDDDEKRNNYFICMHCFRVWKIFISNLAIIYHKIKRADE